MIKFNLILYSTHGLSQFVEYHNDSNLKISLKIIHLRMLSRLTIFVFCFKTLPENEI